MNSSSKKLESSGGMSTSSQSIDANVEGTKNESFEPFFDSVNYPTDDGNFHIHSFDGFSMDILDRRRYNTRYCCWLLPLGTTTMTAMDPLFPPSSFF